MNKTKDLENTINDIHKLNTDLATELQENLQILFKLNIEYCEHCDQYRIDSDWHEDSHGNYICQSCCESIGDAMHDRMQDELWGK